MKTVKVGTIVKHLKGLGIDCRYLSGSYVSLYWRGENVGNIYEHTGENRHPDVHLLADLASVAGPNPDSVDIEIYRDDWKETIDAAVYHLQGSEERFMDMTRAKRVYNVRKYFEKKKAQYIKTLADRLADELNAVGSAFMELNDEQKEMKETTCN